MIVGVVLLSVWLDLWVRLLVGVRLRFLELMVAWLKAVGGVLVLIV